MQKHNSFPQFIPVETTYESNKMFPVPFGHIDVNAITLF